MKYDIVYACGHAGVVMLYGKEKDRQSKLKWYQNTAICPECYKMQKQEEMGEKTAKYNLPELTGSDKQVAWASKIRVDFCDLMETQIDSYDASIKDIVRAARANLTDEQQTKIEKLSKYQNNWKIIKNWFLSNIKASFWIDIRDVAVPFGVRAYAEYFLTNSGAIKKNGAIIMPQSE